MRNAVTMKFINRHIVYVEHTVTVFSAALTGLWIFMVSPASLRIQLNKVLTSGIFKSSSSDGCSINSF